jgi:hypothetical protein
MSYELWDTETRNIIDDFESEDDALKAAQDLVALNPAVYPHSLALVFEDDDGESTLIARGAGLAMRTRYIR